MTCCSAWYTREAFHFSNTKSSSHSFRTCTDTAPSRKQFFFLFSILGKNAAQDKIKRKWKSIYEDGLKCGAAWISFDSGSTWNVIIILIICKSRLQRVTSADLLFSVVWFTKFLKSVDFLWSSCHEKMIPGDDEKWDGAQKTVRVKLLFVIIMSIEMPRKDFNTWRC